ncbi:MAG: histidine phosphatase family protein [Candidatus Competibacterales bacterium]
MSYTLLLMRHAKSAWDDAGLEDFHRPLAPRGRRDGPRMGRWLQRQQLVPQLILSSPATRARQTALLTAEAMGGELEAVRFEPHLYEADPRQLLAVLHGAPDPIERLMVVSHNPGLELLIRALTRGTISTPADGKLMPTAAVAQLVADVPWHQWAFQGAELLAITRPRQLPEE